MIEPVVKEITVAVTPETAFRVFTEDMGKWWPLASHSLSVAKGGIAKSVAMSVKLGGAITETMSDGSLANWGKITHLIPNEEIAFSWQLSRPVGEQTLVTVTFEPSETGTKVRLVHTNWENLGQDAATSREQYLSGWDFVFGECYGGNLEK